MTEEAPEKIALPQARANRPVTLTYRLEYAAMRVIFFILRRLGLERSSALVGGLLRTVGPMIGPVSKRAEANLRYAYPEWPDEEIRETLRGVWDNLGRTVGEYPFLDEFAGDDGDNRLTLNIAPETQDYAKTGKPGILVSGHFANWEAMAIALKNSGLDCAVIYRPVNNPLIDGYIINLRGAVMSRRMIPKGYDGARAAMDHLKAGRSVALLVDQKLTNGVKVPFFGHDAATATAAARLSLRYNAPIIPAAIVRERNAHFTINVRAPIAFEASGNTGDDVVKLTALMTAAIEQEVRAHPEQWLWFHRRWGKDVGR